MLINLTPHASALDDATGHRTTIQPSGKIARVQTVSGIAVDITGIPVPVYGRTIYGDVEGLPAPEPSTFYLVSALVGQAIAGSRTDVLCPGTGPNDNPVRNEKGQILAVTRLLRA